MSTKSKTGSARRKGDEYQDLMALRLALELYIKQVTFELFIEYEHAGSLDDVVVVRPDRVDAYQVKHAVSSHAVYVADDLCDAASVVFVRKFADSWKTLKTRFPGKPLRLHLCSNRGLDSELGELVDDDGFFDAKFQANRYRKDKGKIRRAIRDASGLSEPELKEFAECFHFDLLQPSWRALEQHIHVALLDHDLGISDRKVFGELKRLIERHAIEIAEPITPDILDTFFRETQLRYLVPQVFPVDKSRFVSPPSLKETLDAHLRLADGEYIVVTGPPGSGKSTALSEYFDELEATNHASFFVVRYFCFTKVLDNRRRLRLEAKTLRVNLLTELRLAFPMVLDDHMFDFGEHQFATALERLGTYCLGKSKKLIVFVDGLDHVERDGEIRESVINALPQQVPSGIVFLVGTQELHNWKPLALRHGRQERHIAMPLFSITETRTYVANKCGLSLSSDAVGKIHERSAGLPLYLWYVVEAISDSSDVDTAIDSLPPIPSGDIRTYYEFLWSAFDAQGREHAKYLSAVLCSLTFRVHENELFGFQNGITDRPTFDSASRAVRHLVRVSDGLVSVFHNSFCVFVLQRVDEATKQEISRAICVQLQEERFSSRWFANVFTYALDARDYKYVLDNVNQKFVEDALSRFRSQEEIEDAIDCAIEAADKTINCVALARLGSLKFRTNERLEYDFSWSLLADVLMRRGHVDQVVDTVYSEDSGQITAGEAYALHVINTLTELNKSKLAEKLFEAFLEDFRGSSDIGGVAILTFARLAGMYKARMSRTVRWLAKIRMNPDSLEARDIAPIYAPHLAEYIRGLVIGGRSNAWRRLKRVTSPFANESVRYYLLRAIAATEDSVTLAAELSEYLAAYPSVVNLEVACYAAQVGLPVEEVNRIAGRFDFPLERATHDTLSTELKTQLDRLARWAIVFGYEGNNEIARSLEARVVDSSAVWSCAQLHVLRAGYVIGNHFANRGVQWFDSAKEAVVALEAAGNVPHERTPDALDACRSVLTDSFLRLTKVIVARCPDRLSDWFTLLLGLRKSFIWITHYGIGETVNDFSFEFPLWKALAGVSVCRTHLAPILDDCARSYSGARKLKGGSRSHHFLTIAELAAECGFKTRSEQWTQHGIACSLAYGYHKDTTLSNLIAIAEQLDRHQPARTFSRCGDILEMAKWMSSVTDGRETKHFPQQVFELLLNLHRQHAVKVLRNLYEHIATWQADECLTQYLMVHNSSPDFAWALAAELHPNDSIEVRQQILRMVPHDGERFAQWIRRFAQYMQTMVNPRHWPEELWTAAIAAHPRPKREYRDQSSNSDFSTSEYHFEGEKVTVAQLINQCMGSFEYFHETLDRLKNENEHTPDYQITPKVLPHHIRNCTTAAELDAIRTFVANSNAWDSSEFLELLGRRYLEIGATARGLECITEAISAHLHISSTGFRQPLTILAEHDRERAQTVVWSGLAKELGDAASGFNTPNVVAVACEVLGDVAAIERVFDDYLIHCQEMFTQLPSLRWFDAIRDMDGANGDSSSDAVNLLIDCLNAPAVEHAHRLIGALSDLGVACASDVLPVVIQRLLTADGLLQWRLLAVVSAIAAFDPKLLTEYCRNLALLLERDDFILRESIVKLIEAVSAAAGTLPSDVMEKVSRIQKDYSSAIASHPFGIVHVRPSPEFVELIARGALTSFLPQVAASCDILNLNQDAVIAYLERRLLETGTTVKDEGDEARYMWREFAHPQGWPIIWFVPECQVKVAKILFHLLDEALRKCRYQTEHVEALWRVLQPSDPAYSASRLLAKPTDISPLNVDNEDEWLADGPTHKNNVEFCDSADTDWITVFEFRQVAQDSPYYLEYVAQSHVRSALVKPEIVRDVIDDDDSAWGVKVVTHHPAENLTRAQFVEWIESGASDEFDTDADAIPAVSYKENHPGFCGYRMLASLRPSIIGALQLNLHDLDIFQDSTLTAKFEVWQEGYPDEKYQDEPMSFGTRIRLASTLVKAITTQLGRSLVIRQVDNRFKMDHYKQEPKASKSKTIFRVIL